MSSIIQDLIRKLPDAPGVYQFFDHEQKIIYIGKAKSLKDRVKSYFQSAREQSPKNERLIKEIVDLKWTETNNEVEALTLESNLVKEHQPKYNVLLRDDKHFLYFKITVNEDFPQILTVRRVERDGARYFGPKTDSKAVRDTIRLMQKLFHLRTCNLGLIEEKGKVAVVKKTVTHPCISAHIGLCPAPCDSRINRAEYADLVRQTVTFLSGDSRPIVKELREKMQTAITEKKFELAAQLRDKIQAIESISEKQIVSDPDLASRDVIGLVSDTSKAYLAILEIRNGRLIDQKNFEVRSAESQPEEILSSFVEQYYTLTTDLPKEILLPTEPEDIAVLTTWLSEKANHKVRVLAPQKGKKESLLRLAEKNAAAFRVQSKAKFENSTEQTIGATKELAKTLGIERELKRIEAYDISHLGGSNTVGSMVVFGHGEPKNSDYRQFKIRTLEEGKVDDYASLAEVLGRRMKYLTNQMTEFKFRRPNKKDAELLNSLRLRDWNTKKAIDDPKDFLLAIKDKKTAAISQIHFWKEYKIHGLYSVWVEPKLRGQKLGQELISCLLEKSKASKVYLDCVKNLAEYYSQIGFKLIDTAPDFLVQTLKEYCKQNPQKPKFEDRVFMVWDRKSQIKDPSFSAKPDLVILDGGKGQLSTVLRSVKFPKSTTVVALAKKEEELFKAVAANPEESGHSDLAKSKATPPRSGGTSNDKLKFEKVILPKNSPAHHLVTRLRDEAHRYANSLRKTIQTSAEKESALDILPGVGEKTRQILLSTFGSLAGIKSADQNSLVTALGKEKGEKIYRLFH